MKIIITGASKGIGRGIASFLAMDGHEVGLLARSEDLLDDLQQSIRDQNGESHAVSCDLRDPEATRTAVDWLVERMGQCDGFINNAGLVIRKDIFDISMEEWHAMMDTNVNGLFYATKAILPHFQRQGRGHLINISSISGKLPLAGGSAYAASKHAVTGLSLSLFQECRDHNITVSTIYPGSVASQSHRHGENNSESWKVPPEDVGRVCRDILSADSRTAISEVEIRPLGRPPKS